MKHHSPKRPACDTRSRQFDLVFDGIVLAASMPVTYLLGALNRFVPGRDTITEVLVVLGIVTVIYLFSWTDNLQSVAQQMSPSVSEASPATIHK